MKNIITTLFASAALMTGCSALNQSPKENGYYLSHLNSCGPVAVEKAINGYYHKRGIVFAKNPAPRDEVSRRIQDNGNGWRDFMGLFHENASQVTCPHEVVEVCKQYGFKVVSTGDFYKLDSEKDIALILLYSNLLEWHWVCFPIDKNIPNWYGDSTKIVKVFILEKM